MFSPFKGLDLFHSDSVRVDTQTFLIQNQLSQRRPASFSFIRPWQHETVKHYSSSHP